MKNVEWSFPILFPSIFSPCISSHCWSKSIFVIARRWSEVQYSSCSEGEREWINWLQSCVEFRCTYERWKAKEIQQKKERERKKMIYRCRLQAAWGENEKWRVDDECFNRVDSEVLLSYLWCWDDIPTFELSTIHTSTSCALYISPCQQKRNLSKCSLCSTMRSFEMFCSKDD
jgi:hypothetical protein